MLKKLYLLTITIFVCVPTFSYAQNCGFKPHAQFGCKIGRCVNGKWEQVCGDSASESNQESMNSLIANPKTADIAGALEARQRRIEAEETRKQQVKASQQSVSNQSNLLEFEQLRKTDEASAIAIMSGLGSGFLTANAMLEYKKCLHCIVNLRALL